MGAACSKVSTGDLPRQIKLAEEGRGELILSGCQITEEGAKAIAERLKFSSIERLDLGNNMIGDGGAIRLCEALPENTALKRLVLMGNGLTDDSMHKMVNALLDNRHLRDLDLHRNNITAVGAEQLRRLLQRTHHLESLMVGSNRLGDAGLKHLCLGIRKNHRGKLTKLGLSKNGITNVGAERLWVLLDKRCHSITDVTLTFNDITDYHLTELIEAACKKNVELSAMKMWKTDLRAKAGKSSKKLAGTVEQLSADKLAELRRAFALFDRDGDGTVDEAEIADVMQELGQQFTEQELKDMINDADEDGSGVIEEKEFIAMMARQAAVSPSPAPARALALVSLCSLCVAVQGSDSETSDDEISSGDEDEPADGSFANPVSDSAKGEADEET